MEAFTRHGGRLAAAQAAWPDARRPWIDLSTGVNPLAYPAPRATRAERARLPDPAWLAELEAVAAQAFGAAPERVAAVPGVEAAIRLLPALLGARTVTIATPTYGSHADAWMAAGAELRPAGERAEAVVVVNPNNPDGRVTAPTALTDLLGLHPPLIPANAGMSGGDEDASGAGGWLIVDESFVETAPALSIAGVEHPRLVVLRSFGKFYGLPGLRLGFVVAASAVIARLRTLLGDWPVSADAIAAGLAAYADSAWLARTRQRIAREAARLDAALVDAGFSIVGGTSLFRLASSPNAPARFASLCRAGVLTRPFAEHPTWLRFGLPHPSARKRVFAALGALA